MGTRGTMGVRIDGQDKLTYNHFDSYPDGLGKSMVDDYLEMTKLYDISAIKELARNLVLVDGKSKPTAKQKRDLKQYADTDVSRQTLNDWYCLLRNLQGELAKTLEAGFMIDNHKFMAESLFCEWSYILNLDEMTLEVYTGFMKQPHSFGRYADMPVEKTEEGQTQYYPVALIATLKLEDLPNLPDDWTKSVIETGEKVSH